MVALGGGMCGYCRGGVHGCSRGWGACMVALGGHVWLLWGACVVARGASACMVAPGGHAWLLKGGMCGCSGGACMVALGGVCVVALGEGHAWLLWGGGVHGFFDEIRSMSRRYASYWNAFLLMLNFTSVQLCF